MRSESNFPQSCMGERMETGRVAGASRVAPPALSSAQGDHQGQKLPWGDAPWTHQDNSRARQRSRLWSLGRSLSPLHSRVGLQKPVSLDGLREVALEQSRAISLAPKAGSPRRFQAVGWYGSHLAPSLHCRARVPPRAPGQRGESPLHRPKRRALAWPLLEPLCSSASGRKGGMRVDAAGKEDLTEVP